MEVVVLDNYRVNCAAQRAFFAFAVFEPHFANVFATAGNFNADYCSVIKDIYPVVVAVAFVLVVHDYITPYKVLLSNPNIALDSLRDNPVYVSFFIKKRP